MRHSHRRLNDSEMHTPPAPHPHPSSRQQQVDARPIVRPPLSTCSAVSQHLLILSPPQCLLFILLSPLFFILRPHLFFFPLTSFSPVFYYSPPKKCSFFSPAPPASLHRPVQELPPLSPCVKSASSAVVTSC